MTTEKTIKQAERKASLVEMEIRALETLIERRHIWLQKPNNRQRSTYAAVRNDTAEMMKRLMELNDELDEILNLKNN